MVRTVKSLLKKATDPYLALLAYRATPVANGFSPSELLMGRQIRSVVPKLPHVLHPRVLPWKEIQTKEAIGIEDQKRRFDKRHTTKVLKLSSEGTTVWVRDRREPGKVLQDESTPRSYRVQNSVNNCSKKQATSSEHSTITTGDSRELRHSNLTSNQHIIKRIHLHLLLKKAESDRIYQHSGQGVEDE